MLRSHLRLSKVRKLLMLGPPGAGKGTFAKRVAPHFNLAHLSAGDALRAEVKKNSEIGKYVSSFLSSGALVPPELVCNVMIAQVQELVYQKKKYEGYLLDGFPRTAEQAEMWADKEDQPDLVLNINLDREILVTKLASRKMCADCGDIYNFADIRQPPYDMPPMLPKKEGECDKCGCTSFVTRPDDEESVIRSRLALHDKIERPLLDYYRKHSSVIDFQVYRGVQHTPEVIDLVQTYMVAA